MVQQPDGVGTFGGSSGATGSLDLGDVWVVEVGRGYVLSCIDGSSNMASSACSPHETWCTFSIKRSKASVTPSPVIADVRAWSTQQILCLTCTFGVCVQYLLSVKFQHLWLLTSGHLLERGYPNLTARQVLE